MVFSDVVCENSERKWTIEAYCGISWGNCDWRKIEEWGRLIEESETKRNAVVRKCGMF